jgi:hypothetical protein
VETLELLRFGLTVEDPKPLTGSVLVPTAACRNAARVWTMTPWYSGPVTRPLSACVNAGSDWLAVPVTPGRVVVPEACCVNAGRVEAADPVLVPSLYVLAAV